MDPDSSSPPVATGLTPRPPHQPPSPTRLPSRVPASPPGRVRRDVRLLRSPPKPGKEGERTRPGRGPPGLGLGKTKPWASAHSQTKPLLPVTERKSHEENLAGRRAKKVSQDEDITPDGGSAGREGRQFAVANVGNNGRIYLRPTVRPAHQRYPQPIFVFPMTPPSTAGLSEATAMSLQLPARDWTPSHPPSSSPSLGCENSAEKQIKIRQRHRRAMSDSTLPDTSIARESEPGGFKVVITQPGDDQRPRTVEEMDTNRPPLLEVAIPSWRIGTPRFSVRGTPFIRGSSYAPTEEIRSRSPSCFRLTPQDPPSGGSRRCSFFRGSAILAGARSSDPLSPLSPRLPHRLRATYMSTHLVIEPSMFDALTFKPACDDRTIVRYSTSGTVTAATPPRLVAEITSPSFLDYELLSDFFLTYRSFLEPSDLLRMLFARLRWALRRDDEVGQVVRVRTFVAMRHWILNYFMDDFLVDYDLRVTFCNLINEDVDELSQDAETRKVPHKILGELKKCWRRVCAQFWDGPEFDASLGADVPVAPGGIAGDRDSTLVDPTVLVNTDGEAPRLGDMVVPARGHSSFYAGMAKAGHIDAVVAGDRPGTPGNETDGMDRNGAISPISAASVDVISCSFPTKNSKPAQPGSSCKTAHPVDPSAVYNAEPVATTPRALVSKNPRPQGAHKRNGSLSDSLRDHPTTTERGLYKNAEFLLALPYAGSLVRGNFLPPSQALVEVHSPTASARQTTLFHPAPAELPKEGNVASAMSGQGMKRLLGSVRRALSTKGQQVSPTQDTFINISPIGPRGATTNRLPGTPIVPQARYPRPGRPPVRIDLLGAEVAEDFKKAVREGSEAQSDKPARDSDSPGQYAGLGFSTTHDASPFGLLRDSHVVRSVSDMGITNGSKSIVIVDDTSIAEDWPVMSGALPAVNSSVEAFAEALAPHGADPTPPSTPPGRPRGTPRRSSYILGRHSLRQSRSAEPLPPFILETGTLTHHDSPSQPHARSSLDFLQQDPARPPPTDSYNNKGHTRQFSSPSCLSNRSDNPHIAPIRVRESSATSGTFAPGTVRSFDATTISGESLDDFSPAAAVPQPLRVLRRRPGGDLRAVTNVGDLDPVTLRRRSRSVASLTTFDESLRSSAGGWGSPGRGSGGYVHVDAEYSPATTRHDAQCQYGDNKTFSLGALAERNPTRHDAGNKASLSLFSTHSSKPVMRPSFEAEAQKLALIPDDLDDDGGVETALAKLEGKFPLKKAPKLSMDFSGGGGESGDGQRNGLPPIAVEEIRGVEEDHGYEKVGREEKKEHREVMVAEERLVAAPTPAGPSTVASAIPAQGGGLLDVGGRHSAVRSFLSDDSRASYSSIPLLERGLTDEARSRKTLTKEWTDRSVLQGPDEDPVTPLEGRSVHDSQHPSYDFVRKTESLEKIQQGGTLPAIEHTRGSLEHSFLDVDSDDGSDLSSELSSEALVLEREDGVISPSQIGIAISTLPAHPLGESQPPPARPPSPPITLLQALHMSPETAYVPTLQDDQVWEKPLPPTPETTPTSAEACPFGQSPISSPYDPTGTKEALRHAPKLSIPDPVASTPSIPPHQRDHHSKYSVHLPFILAFDSDILAQQFTLVEKDALNEIDWKELIDMRWKNAGDPTSCSGAATKNVRSWVSFLRDTDARGVEVVIARFNIMVKWAISEVVLTQDIEERARCLVKFIHIASHCRRYRNFATMSQITIALTSNEVSRLSKTWALVPEADKKTLRDLETLMSPTRNFWNLRAEMEGGGVREAEMGCIPFVGIYTHDLLFNAQKPSEIASSPTTAPLVNFERCRTAAGVVKTLLRLLEASMLYDFRPVEGITERCLWMGALADEEIRELSEGLE
ncbi:hypothetical protein VTI74DRAFT_7941 [Chaetomium olivicolor]